MPVDALRTIPRLAVVSVMCSAGDGWALAAWRQPHLLVARPGKSGRSWGAVSQLIGAGLGAVRTGDLRGVSNREVEMFAVRSGPGELAVPVIDATVAPA